ncbi:DMT family transporter [Rhizobium sp. 1399]|jgi:S-adenosylmethionine uptake transporter|uniref:DMT family transporter n=1 Tax=Rhizobium sp. 1399 TaxID=2817758 RepID=UPI00285D402E|nr:DMT family transporter [Rhizobium sp. 1399]MDR6670691.1 S-adenosylmethionine uptake transporter [Rhizobium sp. 1399]
MDASIAARDSRFGIVWLLSDTTLVTGMTVLVKMQGASYPAIQLVFIRALIGLILIAPMIWRHRRQLANSRDPLRNIMRISCNAVALTSNFVALTMLPLVLVNALGFTRPLISMLMAVVMLGERVGRWRWIGAVVAFVGVLITLAPDTFAWNLGLLAVLLSITFGALATIQTRMLHYENTTVMMVFYTAGLTLITFIPALFVWQPVRSEDWPALLGIGLLAQIGQFCFLRAYQIASASLLAPFGYLSIVFATASGYVFFGEVPELRTLIGIIVIIATLQAVAFLEQRRG